MNIGSIAVELLELELLTTTDPQIIQFCLQIEALEDKANERLTNIINQLQGETTFSKEELKLIQLVIVLMRASEKKEDTSSLLPTLEQLLIG